MAASGITICLLYCLLSSAEAVKIKADGASTDSWTKRQSQVLSPWNFLINPKMKQLKKKVAEGAKVAAQLAQRRKVAEHAMSLTPEDLKSVTSRVKNISAWQATSVTTYWDCATQHCMMNEGAIPELAKKCKNPKNSSFHVEGKKKGKDGKLFTAAKLGIWEKDGRLYGTAAGSSSLDIHAKTSPGCGRCYHLKKAPDPELEVNGTFEELTVMVTNWCPSANAMCPEKGHMNMLGNKFNFDLAIPGGGMGLEPNCPQQFGKGKKADYEGWGGADACDKMPQEWRSSCMLAARITPWGNFWNKQMNINFAQVNCPDEILNHLGCTH